MQPQRPASSLIPSLPPSRSWDAGRAGQQEAGGVPLAKFAAECPNPAAHGPTASPGARPRAQGGRTQQGQPEASWRSCSQHHSAKIPPQRLGQATATSGAPVATHLASLAGPHAAKASRVLLVSRSWPLSPLWGPSPRRHPQDHICCTAAAAAATPCIFDERYYSPLRSRRGADLPRAGLGRSGDEGGGSRLRSLSLRPVAWGTCEGA